MDRYQQMKFVNPLFKHIQEDFLLFIVSVINFNLLLRLWATIICIIFSSNLSFY